jgi:hypothetical protein
MFQRRRALQRKAHRHTHALSPLDPSHTHLRAHTARPPARTASRAPPRQQDRRLLTARAARRRRQRPLRRRCPPLFCSHGTRGRSARKRARSEWC